MKSKKIFLFHIQIVYKNKSIRIDVSPDILEQIAFPAENIGNLIIKAMEKLYERHER